MADVKETLNSLLDGRREFEFSDGSGEVKKYYISTPTSDDIKKADWEHAKAYNGALKEGVLTSSEMMDILKTRNIVGPDYNDVGENLKYKLSDKLLDMERETDREKRLRLALEVRDLREEYVQWSQRMSGPMSHTCENIASDARTAYMTSVVVQDEKGSRVWKSFDDYRSERNLPLQTRSRFEVMLWMEGLDADLLDKSPENVAMREIVESVQKEQEELKSMVDEVVPSEPPKTVESPPVEPQVISNAPVVSKKRGRKGKAE
jgi:hypothetical protein